MRNGLVRLKAASGASVKFAHGLAVVLDLVPHSFFCATPASTHLCLSTRQHLFEAATTIQSMMLPISSEVAVPVANILSDRSYQAFCLAFDVRSWLRVSDA